MIEFAGFTQDYAQTKLKLEEHLMSERQEKKRRFNQRLEYICAFNKWLDAQPPMWRVVSWARWKKQRPKYEGVTE